MAEKEESKKQDSTKKESENQKSNVVTKKSEDGQDKNNNSEDEVSTAEVIENLPPGIKKSVEMAFSMQRVSGSMPNPIMEKITDKHIDKILDLGEKEENNNFENTKISRRYTMAYVIIAIALFVFLTVFLLKDNRDVYLEILKFAIAIAGGFGSGYGTKAYLDRRKPE